MAIIQPKTRAERGLSPYVSPKKDWDESSIDETLQPTFTVIEPATSSTRAWKRQRRRDFDRRQRKATAGWKRQQRKDAFDKDTAAAMGRVYFGDYADRPEMFCNVADAVYSSAEHVARERKQRFEDALNDVEGELRKAMA